MSRRRLAAIAASAGGGITPPPVTNQMVLGSAVAPYPDRTETYAQAYASHNADIGVEMGVLRSYSTTAQTWPTTWSALGGNHPRQGNWLERWSWHSMKNDPISIASGAQYQNIINFVTSIPVTGYKRMLTWWHESDVGTKIPDNMSYSQCKQMLYEAGRAVKAAGHPDVLYGPVWGSKFTISKANTIMAATWGGLTVAQSTALLASVLDFSAWDPYNLASQNGDYSAGFQGAAGAAFYLDACKDWNDTYFPNARFAIGEVGYRPTLTDLTLRPQFMQAYVDRCASFNALAVCYFDDAVTTGKQNYIRIIANPRSDATDTSLNWQADTASITKWHDLYVQYPAYQS